MQKPQSAFKGIPSRVVAGIALFGGVLVSVNCGQAPLMRVAHEAWVGDVLPSVPEYTWKHHRGSLVLAARVGCVHCRNSVPFYKELSDLVGAKQEKVGFIAIFPDSAESIRSFKTSFDLKIESVASMPLRKLKVTGTPTLMLVDSNGTVRRTWIGELDTTERKEIISELRMLLDASGG